jgi:hypothetical protein
METTHPIRHSTTYKAPATSRRLATLETMASVWAEKIGLRILANGICQIASKELQQQYVADIATMAYSEGAHQCFTSGLSMIDAPPHAGSSLRVCLADALLEPRSIERDEQGFLSHPALPHFDADVPVDKVLAAFGVVSAYVGLEAANVDSALKGTWHEARDYRAWNPAPPSGDAWMLLEIFETQTDIIALFGRRAPLASRPARHCHARHDGA